MKKLLGFVSSTAISAGLRAISLPLLGWLVAPAVLAEYALWHLALTWLVMLAGLGLGHAVMREFHSLPAVQRPLLLLHAISISMLVAGCIALLALLSGMPLPLLLLAMAAPLQLFLLQGSQYLRLQLAAERFAVIQVGGRCAWLLCLLLAWALADGLDNLVQVLLVWVAVESVLALLMLWMLRGEAAACWNQRQLWLSAEWLRRLRGMLRYGRPLLLAESLYLCMGALGAILLTAWHGLDSMAVYAMAVSIGSSGSLLGQLFNTLWLPEVYRLHAENQVLPWLRRNAWRIVLAAMALTVLAVLGAFVFVQLLPEHYADVPWLVAATFMKPLLMALQRVTAIGVELHRKTWVSPVSMIAGLLLQLVLSWLLIPGHGAAGAVVSLLLGVWLFWQLKSLYSSRMLGGVGSFSLYLMVFAGVVVACVLALR